MCNAKVLKSENMRYSKLKINKKTTSLGGELADCIWCDLKLSIKKVKK
jgi:hypothetical protein